MFLQFGLFSIDVLHMYLDHNISHLLHFLLLQYPFCFKGLINFHTFLTVNDPILYCLIKVISWTVLYFIYMSFHLLCLQKVVYSILDCTLFYRQQLLSVSFLFFSMGQAVHSHCTLTHSLSPFLMLWLTLYQADTTMIAFKFLVVKQYRVKHNRCAN